MRDFDLSCIECLTIKCINEIHTFQSVTIQDFVIYYISFRITHQIIQGITHKREI